MNTKNKLKAVIMIGVVLILAVYIVLALAVMSAGATTGQHRPQIWMPVVKVECTQSECAEPILPAPPVCDKQHSTGVCE